MFVFSLGYNVSESYRINPLAGGVVAFSSLIVTLPEVAEFSLTLPGVAAGQLDALTALGLEGAAVAGEGISIAAAGWGYIGLSYTGAAGLFSALVIGLISSMIYRQILACYNYCRTIAISSL